MTELEMFNSLLLKNPHPGIKVNIQRIENNYYIPGWVFDSNEEFVVVSYKNIKKRFPSKFNLIGQIIYDILVLGLINLKDRPRCPICGKYVEYESFSRGYKITCGDKACISSLAEEEVSLLWEDKNYRDRQSKSHVEWASKDENRQKLREQTLTNWKDEDYRKRQSESHIRWAKDETNRARMRETSLRLWQDPTFLNKMMNRSSGSILRGNESSLKTSSGLIHYDSSWERDFIRFCNECDKIKTIERSNIVIDYEYNNVSRKYYPDFLITTTLNRTLLVEVKCDWLVETDEKTPLKLIAGENYVRTSNTIDDYVVLLGLDIYENLGYTKINETKLKEKLKLI